MTELRFAVPGDVRGKGRPRFAKRGKFVKVYTDEKTASYEYLVQLYAAAEASKNGWQIPAEPAGYIVWMDIAVAPPASWPKWKLEAAAAGHIRPAGKPDIDNCIKAVFDALNGLIWRDDSEVVNVVVNKEFHSCPALHCRIQRFIQPSRRPD